MADDAYDDGTRAAVQAIPDPRVRCLAFAERRGKAACVNDAVAAAVGDILVLTDARQAVAQDALEKLVRCLGDASVGVASGELVFRPESGGSGVGEGMRTYWGGERWLRRRESLVHSVPGATGALYAMRRGLFPPIPADTILDDVYVPMKVMEQGFRCVLVSGAHVFDDVSATPGASLPQAPHPGRLCAAGAAPPAVAAELVVRQPQGGAAGVAGTLSGCSPVPGRCGARCSGRRCWPTRRSRRPGSPPGAGHGYPCWAWASCSSRSTSPPWLRWGTACAGDTPRHGKANPDYSAA